MTLGDRFQTLSVLAPDWPLAPNWLMESKYRAFYVMRANLAQLNPMPERANNASPVKKVHKDEGADEESDCSFAYR